MYNSGTSSPSFSGCTFSGNLADSGGGIYNSYSNPALTNCILWGDTAKTSGNEVYNDSSTPTFSYCDVEGGVSGNGNMNSDPQFLRKPDAGDDATWGTTDDDYGDLHLTDLSPCIDAGDPSAPGDTDIDGEIRIVDGDLDGTPTIDIGADEFVDSDGDGISDREETRAIVTTAISGSTSEEGDSATVDVKFNGLPDGDVVLTVSSDDTSEGTVSPPALTFTTANWNTYQTVTVTGVDDDEDDDDQIFAVLLDVDDDVTDDTTGYKDLSPVAVSVTNIDDDTSTSSDGGGDGSSGSGSSSGGGGGCFIGSLK